MKRKFKPIPYHLCVHEVGHAVVGIASGRGLEAFQFTFDFDSNGWEGEAIFTEDNRDDVAKIKTLFGGMVSEKAILNIDSMGLQSDNQRISELATKHSINSKQLAEYQQYAYYQIIDNEQLIRQAGNVLESLVNAILTLFIPDTSIPDAEVSVCDSTSSYTVTIEAVHIHYLFFYQSFDPAN